jgi:cytochrome c553
MMYRKSLLPVLLLALSTSVTAIGTQQTPATTISNAPLATVTDLRHMQAISGDALAGAGKAAVCVACHGTQGIAISPMFANLAGQSASYLYVQLKEFHDGQREDPVMIPQVAALNDVDMRDLASYFASLPPKPAGKVQTTSRGAQLYLAGDPAQGVPPCQGCHGQTGLGPRPNLSSAPQPPWGLFPRLRGQSSTYLAKQLGDYKSGVRVGNSNAKVMQGVAQTLSDDDVQALSSYLSTL